MRRGKQFIGMKSVLTQWALDSFRRFSHMSDNGEPHVDPPAHFIKGLRTVDQIDLKEMILPLVVIDVHSEAERTRITL